MENYKYNKNCCKQQCLYYFCSPQSGCLKSVTALKVNKHGVVIRVDSHIKKKSKVSRLYAIGHKEECVCCGSKENLTYDHIIPRAKGGVEALSNGQVLCRDCNHIKADLIISISELRILISEKQRNKVSDRLNKLLKKNSYLCRSAKTVTE